MFNLEKAIMPTPALVENKHANVQIGYAAGGGFSFEASGEGDIFEQAKIYMHDTFAKKASLPESSGYSIILSVEQNNPVFDGIESDEAYFIEVSDSGAHLCAKGGAGAYYAAVTFAQILFEYDGKLFLPLCRIVDYPRFEKRGHFMENRYGSDFMISDDWEKALDYLSQMKINTVVCGIYGCWVRQYDGEFAEYLYIPFEKYPELKTPRNIKYYSAKQRCMIYKKDVLPRMFEDDYFARMIEYGKKKNIQVIPLFNSLGHNTLIPRVFPEISAIDENGEYSKLGFCTNNEKTYEILFDLYDEIIDRYLAPHGIDSFEIGLDEIIPVLGVDANDLQRSSSPICKCSKCRSKDFGELIIDYIVRITQHLKSKGINNVYVYHDMLFNHGLITEQTAQRFKDEGIYDNIIIDWWSYENRGKNFKGRESEVNSIFRSVGKSITGYFHWNMPSQMNENVYAITEIAEKHGFEGVIGYSTFEYCYDFNYRVFAECAWRGNEAADCDAMLEKYVHTAFPENPKGAYDVIKNVENIMAGRWIDKNPCMDLFEYYISSYLSEGAEYPQDYPTNAMRKIRDDEKYYLSYLSDVKAKAKELYEFFNQNSFSQESDIWKLIGAQYMTLADEFYTVYTCAMQYCKGVIDAESFISELNRVISLRDKTISLCESVRIEANQYTCIRDMTVTRQFVCDLRDYIKREIAGGNKPEVDIFNFSQYLGKMSYFFR